MARRKKKSTAARNVTANATSANATSADTTLTALPVGDNRTSISTRSSANTTDQLKVPSIGSDPSNARNNGKENAEDDDDFAKVYAAREDALTDEELYLLCKYQALLILTLHDLKPVVYLDHKNIKRELDTFHSGYLNEDGLEKRHAPYCDEERMQKYHEMCERVVARQIDKITEKSEDNYRQEPKNRIIDGKNPEHAAFSRVIISAMQFKEYCAIVKNPSPNVDIYHPKKSKLIYELLRKIVNGQYDYQMWHHFPPKPKFNQVPRLIGEGKNEELQYTTDHPDQIFGVVDVKIPGTEKRFYQMDVFHDIPEPINRPKAKHMHVYYIPCPDVFIIPKPLQNKRWAGKSDWVVSDYDPDLWERADGKTWMARIGTRMFDNKTHEYLEFCHPDLGWLRDVNPNNEEWRRKYNDYFHGLGGDYSADEEDDEVVVVEDKEKTGGGSGSEKKRSRKNKKKSNAETKA
ncbi:hypothetical protein GMOD_00003541 [Pyrenophora seminiperda CCB06]|uniref:Uncharacterized protein n=1 Tax=Pyrenophora seminiperda CCB06 TaxID=1302712 RepID=A0A3M7MJF6_9PLEO|nr:hypothetical protein GMOD_00003541 [Pyrenophora seminiperda CCB06]